jgi:hypothetical protein
MGKYIMIFIFSFGIFTVSAQTEAEIVQTIKGKVINKATNEAVSYTNIGIENTFHGTASDEEGNFQLKIPQEMASGDIYFSAIGYRNEKFPVASLFDREFNIIKLEPQSYSIEDVDIAAQSKVLIRILRMASENTPYNFLGGPFNLICQWEQEKITDDTTRVLENAEVLIYDKSGYRNPSKTDAFRMRKYEITKEEPDYSFSTGIINFDELLELDWVRSSSSVMNPSLLSQFDLELTAEPEADGKSFWVISFSLPDPTPEGSRDFHATSFHGKITINKEDYSVEKIEGSVNSARHNRQGKSLAVGPSNAHFFEDVTYNFEVTYSRLKPDVLRLDKKYRFNGQEIEERSRLTVTRVQMADVKEIASRDYFVE